MRPGKPAPRLLVTAVVMAVVASYAACRRQQAVHAESTLLHTDASVDSVGGWTEESLRAFLLQAQSEILGLHGLKRQPPAPGDNFIGVCGAMPAMAGPARRDVEDLGGRRLAGHALECVIQEYWGCRIGDRIGFVDWQRDEQEWLFYTRSRVRIIEQSAERVTADVDMSVWTCMTAAYVKDDRDCPDPTGVVRYQLDKGADGVWRISQMGSGCDLLPARRADHSFKLTSVVGDGAPVDAVGQPSDAPTVLDWASSKGASARYEAAAPVLVDAVLVGSSLGECSGEPVGANVELDDGERFELKTTQGYAMHRFKEPRLIRSIQLTPLPHAGPVCLGRLVIAAGEAAGDAKHP